MDSDSTGTLVARIRQLEASAQELDTQPEKAEGLWDAVGGYVHERLANRAGEAMYRLEDVGAAEFAIAETPSGISEALATIAAVDRSGVNQSSGGHFAFIPGGGLFPAALGDLLADVGNRYAGIHYGSPAASLMERSLVRWIAGIVGYPDTAGGDLTSGGSIANLEGIVTAREAAGIRSADVPRTVVYLTDQTHHSIEKALRIAGLGEAIVQRVDVDSGWRMRPDALAAAVEADTTAGRRPWLVVATAGTTDTGAVDPLMPIADIADAYGLWLHVDAAYGGFFMLTEHGRRTLAGIERSRSAVLDPHKGLFLPFGSGALVVREERQLADAHRYSAAYLQDARETGGIFSSSDLSPELSRPFRGPRLWLPLKLFGLAPFRAALDEKLLLARYFHARLSEIEGWIVGPEPDLSVVTYRYAPRRGDPNEFNRRLVENVAADGRALISATEIAGTYTLRIAVLQYRSHLADIDALIEALVAGAARLQEDV